MPFYSFLIIIVKRGLFEESMNIIGTFLLFVLQIVNLALMIRVFLSWITLPPNRFTYYLNQVTDPIVNFSRKYFPLRVGILDLSILVPFFIIWLLNRLVSDIFLFNKLTRPVFWLIDFVIFIISGALNVVFSVVFILLLIYLVMTLLARASYSPLFYSIRSVMSSVLVRMEKLFKMPDTTRSEVICIIVIIICAVIVSGLLNFGLTMLSSFLNDVMKI